MPLRKNDFFFLILLTLVGFAAWFSWSGYSHIQNLEKVNEVVADAVNYSFLGTVFSLLSAFCVLFLVYPMTSRGVRESVELRQMTASLSERSQNLEQAAATDPLTGMHNRRYFNDAMNEYLRAFRTIDRPVGMAVLDLDHFKQVNDTYGHDVGDEVLRQVSGCLLEFARYHDVVARLGGEEFAILMPNITQRQLHSLTERLRCAVDGLRIAVGEQTLQITLSAGIAIWDGRESGDELYRRADKQLYKAKRQGRNRVCSAA